MDTILFVTHECSGTGAPILFLSIIRHLVDEHDYSRVDILGLKPGEKIEEFSSLGNLFVCPSEWDIHDTAGNSLQKDYDYIYTNTVETAHVLPVLAECGALGRRTRVISHVHELDGTIKKYGADRLSEFTRFSHAIICVSEAVRNNLLKYGLPEDRVHVVYPSVRPPRFVSPNKDDAVFTVLGCGEITVWKGIDVFIDTARKALALNRDMEFVWLGADNYKIREYFEEDIRRFGLEKEIRFLGYDDDISPYFRVADLFYLSSRQDSFPLVCLEAASIGLPSLYYPDAGGIRELFGEDAGFPLPYLDTEYAANLIIQLVKDRERRRIVGEEAKRRFERLCSESVMLSNIECIVSGDIDGRKPIS